MSLYEKSVLRVSHIEESTDLLGPYNRFVIWTHGCCFDCEGCLATNTKAGSYQETNIWELADIIAQSSCEGITASGGEPFLQASALLELIRTVKAERDIGVIVYSGFTIDEIKSDKEKSNLLSVIDVLIDGKYIKELDDGRAYVGSSNQVIHYLTSRYRTVGEKYYSQKKRMAEIKLTPSQAVLIGVPSKNVLKVRSSFPFLLQSRHPEAAVSFFFRHTAQMGSAEA